MKKLILVIAAITLASCQMNPSTDPHDLSFTVPIGSSVSLNQTMHIEHGFTHGVIQNGKQISEKDKDDYQINCRLDFKKFGPRSIKAQSFTVTKADDSQDWVSQPNIMRFSTELFLSSNQSIDIIKLACQDYGDGMDRNFTVAQMQAALGQFISISFKNSIK